VTSQNILQLLYKMHIHPFRICSGPTFVQDFGLFRFGEPKGSPKLVKCTTGWRTLDAIRPTLGAIWSQINPFSPGQGVQHTRHPKDKSRLPNTPDLQTLQMCTCPEPPNHVFGGLGTHLAVFGCLRSERTIIRVGGTGRKAFTINS